MVAKIVQDAAKEIRKLCPNQVDARIWYDHCFLRYDTTDFRGQVDTYGTLYANVQNVTDSENFKQKLHTLINKTIWDAVHPGNKGLGVGAMNISTSLTLYALVECTGDLSRLNCGRCLTIAIKNLEGFCNNKKGCQVLYSTCNVRYEDYPFYLPLKSKKPNLLNHASVVSKA